MQKSNYYVYVYIDPRNYEEFYYGKGIGERKYSHLEDTSDTEKTKRIKEIRKAGLEPIIKVIAKGLTEHDALLVEKTLIWKLGKNLTNISSGHFAENFRRHNTFHLELEGFDFENGIYLLNVGEGPHRSWADCRKYGFMSAGQTARHIALIRDFKPNDIIAAYWSKKGEKGGYVGIGVVKTSAIPIKEFKIKGQSLSSFPLTQPNIFENSDNTEKSEWAIEIAWIKTVDEKNCKFISKVIFSTPSTKASLEKQLKTLKFLEQEFGINFSNLRKQTK